MKKKCTKTKYLKTDKGRKKKYQNWRTKSTESLCLTFNLPDLLLQFWHFVLLHNSVTTENTWYYLVNTTILLLFIICNNKFTHTQTYIYIYIYIYNNKILNIITNAPTYFGAFAPSSGRFDIAPAKVMKY
jgi:hypothetical protein